MFEFNKFFKNKYIQLKMDNTYNNSSEYEENQNKPNIPNGLWIKVQQLW